MTRKQPSREALDRKNAAARARRAAARTERERILKLAKDASLPVGPSRPGESASTVTADVLEKLAEPVPCPFCDKLFPGVYGQPGVAMLRADGETLICAECGTREALEGGLRMPVWKFLESYGSHDIYLAEPVARRFLVYTGRKAPWTPTSAAEIRRQIAARGLGGSYEGNAPGVAGFVMAEACAHEFARFHSLKMGRGSAFRECIEALRGNGI